jgi:hypothetical protein
LRHRPERFDIEAQRHRRKLRSKRLQRVDHAPGRQHHVKDEMDFCLEALEKASHLGAKPVDPVGDGARLRQDRAASFRQHGFARRLAIEQQDPELRLQVGNRIADDRCRPAKPSRRAREAAHLDHGQKDPQLIERRRAGVG